MSEFDAHKTMDEVNEQNERGRGSRWIPIAAALLALLAAVAGLLGGLRVTESNSAKSDAIIATAKAADAYNEYESRSIKQHIYESLLLAGVAKDPAKLRDVADHEKSGKPELLEKAKGLEEAAKHDLERSEHVLKSHEILEVATTLFEIGIVLVSISTLIRSRLLPAAAGVAGVLALLIAVAGVLY